MRSEPLMLFEKLQTKEDIEFCIIYSLHYCHECASAALDNWHIWNDELKSYFAHRVKYHFNGSEIDLDRIDEVLREMYNAPHIQLSEFLD